MADRSVPSSWLRGCRARATFWRARWAACAAPSHENHPPGAPSGGLNCPPRVMIVSPSAGPAPVRTDLRCQSLPSGNHEDSMTASLNSKLLKIINLCGFHRVRGRLARRRKSGFAHSYRQRLKFRRRSAVDRKVHDRQLALPNASEMALDACKPGSRPGSARVRSIPDRRRPAGDTQPLPRCVIRYVVVLLPSNVPPARRFSVIWCILRESCCLPAAMSLFPHIGAVSSYA